MPRLQNQVRLADITYIPTAEASGTQQRSQ
jgi:hypothetical protein